MTFARITIAIFVFKMAVFTATALDLRNRSTSSSGQFTIYCDDREIRSAATGLTEEVKSHVLKLLQEPDAWRFPIVISLYTENSEDAKSDRISMAVSNGMVKIDVIHEIKGENWSEGLQRKVIGAVILELCYRDDPPRNSGERFVFPPWWIVAGARETISRENDSIFREVLKNALETEKLPGIEKFVSTPPVTLQGSIGIVDRAFATCLLDALASGPDGGKNLARFVKTWPMSHGDPVSAVLSHFPFLNASSSNMDKWWMIQIARFGTSERWQTLSLQESEAEISSALEFEFFVEKNQERQKFTIHEYPSFLKLPDAKTVLAAAQMKIITLSAKVHPLLRPACSDYEQIIGRLIANKTRGLKNRLNAVENFRKETLGKMSEVTDYLNWYQATQIPASSGSFIDYLNATISIPPKENADSTVPSLEIANYLNGLEKVFSPSVR